jgi:putative FmdB family regulatory protein
LPEEGGESLVAGLQASRSPPEAAIGGGIAMPIYDYTCEKCSKKFSVRHSITEHDHKRVFCPKCHSRKLQRRITSFLAKTSKKS